MEPSPSPSPTAVGEGRSFAWAAAIVMAGTVASRLLGLARQQVFAIEFGTTGQMDAFWTAFRLPDIIYNIVAGGLLGSSLIPVFAGYLAQDRREEAARVASSVMNLMFILLSALALLLELFAPLIVPLLVSDYSPDKQQLVVVLTRILLIQPLFLGVSGVMMGVLNTYQHFLLPTLAPIVYNLSIIVAALALGPRMGVEGLAIGVVAGALLQVVAQWPGMVRYGFRWSPTVDAKDPGVREVWRLMIPRVFASATLYVNLLIQAALASQLVEGAYTGYSNALQLMMLPIGIFAISLSIVAFPTLSAQVARAELGAMSRTLGQALRLILFLTIPSSIGLVLLREPIIRTLFQYGAFDARSTALTAQPLIFFALGLFGHATIEIVLRAFYALRETLRPVLINLVTLSINLVLSFALIGPLQQGGLALAISISVSLEALALLVLLQTRLPAFDWAGLAGTVGKCVLASAVMGAALYAFVHASGVPQAVGPRVLQLALAIGIGGSLYLAAAALLRLPELSYVRRLAWRRSPTND
ncbi:MAG TPA: murein biosynthesis integral membrane protein MurJ [Chloroflexota bacterium]|nr:murein biosynthesis integral membrane protein MurJ [Chloroflexota bacterium]